MAGGTIAVIKQIQQQILALGFQASVTIWCKGRGNRVCREHYKWDDLLVKEKVPVNLGMSKTL